MKLLINHLIAHANLENNCIAKVLEISGNDLKVQITNGTNRSWVETWNLSHTQAELKEGEYYIMGLCHDE